MIWTITPNPALDLTWRVPAWQRGRSHRVADVAERPGGKGLNVARVLDQMGVPVSAAGFLGGGTGARVRDLLAQASPRIRATWIEAPGETRRSVAIIDGDATVFNEAGAPVPASAWADLTRLVADRVRPGDVVALSGSLPPGTDAESLSVLLAAAREAGARTLADTSGPLLLVAAAHADVVKPNEEELLSATAPMGARTIDEGARALLARGTRCVVVSLGARGMERHTPGGVLRARLPRALEGNPTGAGDAAVAALARHLAGASTSADGESGAPETGDALLTETDREARDALVRADAHRAWDALDWEDALRDAVATSAAAVVRPVAGEIDPAVRAALLPQIVIERTSHAR